MKKYCTIISLALFSSLFVYLVYRTQHTVVNIMLSKLSHGKSIQTIVAIRHLIPLSSFMIYSLPEALWVFAATLVCKHLYVKIRNQSFHLVWTPFFYAVSLEFLQLLKITPGKFDVMDMLPSLVLSLYAIYFIKCPLPAQQLLRKFNYRTFFFIYIYAIVFLSHVSA